MSNGVTKICIIGIDGGTFRIVRPLLKAGRLPNLARLIRNGVSSELLSIVPPITAPAWVSFMTGVNPGKHGIFDFVGDIHSGATDGPLLSANNIRARTLWQILSDYNRRMILVGIPFTYPAVKVNGVMVGITPAGSMSTYPGTLRSEITQVVGYEEDSARPVNTFGAVPRQEVFDELILRANYATDKAKDITLYLMQKYEWDVMMTVFMSTDTMQHYFWSFTDPGHPAYDPSLAPRYREVINETYVRVDGAIGEILHQAGDETSVIIMSDHGFAPVYKFFYLNKWLEKQGWLRVKRGPHLEMKIAKPSVFKLLKKIGWGKLGDALPRSLRELEIPALKLVPKPLSEWIDWKATRAYASPFGININLHGREPHGIVKPDYEYDMLREEIKKALLALRDSEAGEPFVEQVIFREEVYHGPYVDNAADIFFIAKQPNYLQVSELSQGPLFRSLTRDHFATANHRYSPEGILLMRSPGIISEEVEKVPSLLDIAPTVLALSGLPIPQHFDGRVLSELLNPDFLRTQPLHYSKDDTGLEEIETTDMPEQESIKNHLRSLGYLG